MNRCPLLVAYPYLTPDKITRLAELGDGMDLMVDSGAFTAWQARKSIRLQSYCDFLHHLPIRPTCYVALDVVGNPRRTRENFDEMRKQGLQPVPVWTRGDTEASLEYYYEHSTVVALGGLAKTGTSPVPYLMSIRHLLRGRPVHMFGMTRMDVLRALRPHSCDSSSYTTALRYGRCALYLGAGRMTLLSRAELQQPPTQEQMLALARMGYDGGALRAEHLWRGGTSMSSSISIASWLLLSRDVKRWLGTTMYLAHAMPIDLIWREWMRLRPLMGVAA